jgi:hypothetical protein
MKLSLRLLAFLPRRLHSDQFGRQVLPIRERVAIAGDLVLAGKAIHIGRINAQEHFERALGDGRRCVD